MIEPSAPAYEQPRRVLAQALVVLQRNPGPMTLDGTNTWVLAAPHSGPAVGSAGVIVVDPGEDDPCHLDALTDAAPDIDVIVLTHHHHDHSGAAEALHARTGAPVRAADPRLCRDGEALRDGEVIHAAGVTLQVLATPGHTADSVCLLLDDQAVLTGDTILGRGTTVVAHPDGALAPYLESLRVLRELHPPDRPDAALRLLPGHGPERESVATLARQYLAHREQRLDQVRAALARLGAQASAQQVVDSVYADVAPAVRDAARWSVEAQLHYLRGPL